MRTMTVGKLKELLANYDDENIVELEVITQDYADAYLTIGEEVVLEYLM